MNTFLTTVFIWVMVILVAMKAIDQWREGRR